MNFQFYLEKLHDSDIFKKFMSENPSAFLCSGFFAIDKEAGSNKKSFDFFNPKDKKMFSFKLEEEIELVPIQNFSENIEKISECDFDFEEIENLIAGKMSQENVKNKIQKILVSLQNKQGKNFLLGTIFISGFGIIKATIDLTEKKITDFDKKSIFDMINVLRKE